MPPGIFRAAERVIRHRWGRPTRLRFIMLYYALIFLLVALIAGAVGFFALAGIAATIAKVLFIVFLVIFLISLLGGRRRPPAI